MITHEEIRLRLLTLAIDIGRSKNGNITPSNIIELAEALERYVIGVQKNVHTKAGTADASHDPKG